MSRTEGAHGFRLTTPGADLSEIDLPPLTPEEDQVVVKVAGCGICHTDISYAYGGVPTRHPLPLILGHEIAGQVVDAGKGAAGWLGKSVIVPAVIPCGTCEACHANRPTICRHQFMPGNDGDGGFATHVVVPARGLCPVPDVLPDGLTLDLLAIIADAVTTPYEAMERAGVGADDVVVVVGAGGIGGFGVQIAAARGAKVVAIDVDDDRLKLALMHGASLALNPKLTDLKSMKTSVRGFARETGRGRVGTKIFEMSGMVTGQETAFGLLDFGSYLGVVGYTPDKVALRLSNLMALDATARGNWGCAPANYPKALALVLDRKIVLEPYVERHSLADLPQVFRAASRHEIRRRVIVTPQESR